MNRCVYILYSCSLKKYYTGFSGFPGKRERQHRSGQTYWTSRANDWEQVWSQAVGSREEARRLERQIKARGAARFLGETNRGPAPSGAGLELVTPKA
jgi:putative endonuclease